MKPHASCRRNPLSLCDLGLALKETGDLPNAITALRQALELKPDLEKARYALGVALHKQGQTAEAAAEMRDIRQIHQSRVRLAQSNKLILEGVDLLKRKEFEQAAARFEESAKLSPELPSSYYYLGLANERRDPNDAQQAYLKALALKPDYAEAHMRLGILYARQNNTEAALGQLHEAVLSDPDLAEAHYNLALMLSTTGKIEEAENELNEAVSISPDSFDARMLLGNLLAQQNHVDQAAAVYREVIRRSPESAEAYNNLGLVLLQAGKFSEAKSEFEGAIRRKRNYPAAHYNRGLALLKSGDSAAARAEFEIAHRLDPQIP